MAGLWVGLLCAARAPWRHRRAVHRLRREAARLRRRNRRLILLHRRLAGRMLELELLAGWYTSDTAQ